MNYSECWFKPIIPELGRQRQKDQEFKATVSYIEKKQSQSGHFRKKKHISEETFTYMAHCSLSFQIFHLSSTSRHFSKVKLIQETGCPPHPTPPHPIGGNTNRVQGVQNRKLLLDLTRLPRRVRKSLKPLHIQKYKDQNFTLKCKL